MSISSAIANTLAPGTYTATLNFNNTSNGQGNTSRTVALTVRDITPPVFTGVPPSATIEANTTGGATYAAYSTLPTATDAVDGLRPVTASLPPGTTFPLTGAGPTATTVTFTAEDTATPPNLATASFTVTVQDTTPPSFNATPPDIPVEATSPAGAAVTFNPAAISVSDIADPNPAITFGTASGSIFQLGTTPVTVTATDASGNAANATFNVIVRDTTAPTLVGVPANISVNADPGAATAVVNFAAPTATDTADPAPTVTLQTPLGPGSAFPLGTSTVTYEARDASGNTISRSFTVTVLDAEAPTITVPPAITIATDPGQSTAVVTYTVNVHDNSGIPPTLTQIQGLASGSPFPVGVTTNTFQATDGDGNTSTQSFTVTVTDNEAPTVVSAPGNISQNTDPGLVTAVVTYATPTFADNVAVANVIQTAGLASGSPFPIGKTTNTFTSSDAEGNTVSVSFDVTITDNQPPMINSLPANITVSVDFPATSSVVTFGTPTVTDNAPGVTIVQEAGLGSGSAFPLGTTTNTFKATDASGNVVTASFTVTINQIPPGQVTIAVVTGAGDNTFVFSSPEPQFNFSVATSGGVGNSTPLTIKPGTYVISASLPSGFALASGTCADSDSAIDVGAGTATINLASGEVVTCTFSALNSRKKTVEVISNFLNKRNDLLLSNGPDADRQIDRLKQASGKTQSYGEASSGFGEDGGAFTPGPSRLGATDYVGSPLGGVTAASRSATRVRFSSGAMGEFGAAALGFPATGDEADRRGGLSPIALTGSNEGQTQLSFSASLSRLAQYYQSVEQRKISNQLGDAMGIAGLKLPSGKTAFTPFDVWVEGHYLDFSSDSDNDDSDGRFGVVYIGADYVVTPWLLVGALVQYDALERKSEKDQYEIKGHGFMAGPYATVQLSENVYLQGRAAWGTSDNEVSPFLTYTDSFDTSRWLVSGTLKGDWDYGPWLFRPSASLSYIEDASEAYTDSLGVRIPGVEAALGQVKAGPQISYRTQLDNGTLIEPHASLEVIWNFESSNDAVNFGGTLAGPEEVRARIEAGVKAQVVDGLSLDVSGTYDGIGSDSFGAYGGKAMARMPLN